MIPAFSIKILLNQYLDPQLKNNLLEPHADKLLFQQPQSLLHYLYNRKVVE